MSQKIKKLNISSEELDRAIFEAAEQASKGVLLDSDWTIKRLMDKYPNLSERAARGILHKMAEEGKADVIKVKNDKGAGGFILAYRAKGI